MKNEKRWRYIILGVYVVLMMARMTWGGGGNWRDLIGLVVGAMLGFEMNWFDRVAYIYITRPEAHLSLQVQYWIKNKEIKRAFEAVRDRVSEMDRLTTKSAMFQVVWVGLAFFALTSIGNSFGKILVMGLGLEMVVSQWMSYEQDKALLKKELFWQVKREIGDDELKKYLQVMIVVFGLLSMMFR